MTPQRPLVELVQLLQNWDSDGEVIDDSEGDEDLSLAAYPSSDSDMELATLACEAECEPEPVISVPEPEGEPDLESDIQTKERDYEDWS